MPVLLARLTDEAEHELVNRPFLDGLHPAPPFAAADQADVLLRLAAALERDAHTSRHRGETARATDLAQRADTVWQMALSGAAGRTPAQPPLCLVAWCPATAWPASCSLRSGVSGIGGDAMPQTGAIFVIGGRSFECLGSLGKADRGSFGEVFPARAMDGVIDGDLPADIVVKVVNLDKLADLSRDADADQVARHYDKVFRREIDGLKGIRVKHGDPHLANIVQLLHHGVVSAPAPYAGTLALVMRRYSGSLRDVRADPSRPEVARAAQALKTLPGFLAFMRAGAMVLSAVHSLPGNGAVGAHREEVEDALPRIGQDESLRQRVDGAKADVYSFGGVLLDFLAHHEEPRIPGIGSSSDCATSPRRKIPPPPSCWLPPPAVSALEELAGTRCAVSQAALQPLAVPPPDRATPSHCWRAAQTRHDLWKARREAAWSSSRHPGS